MARQKHAWHRAVTEVHARGRTTKASRHVAQNAAIALAELHAQRSCDSITLQLPEGEFRIEVSCYHYGEEADCRGRPLGEPALEPDSETRH